MSTGAELIDAWRERGRRLELQGHRVFAVDCGPRDAPAVLFLHGFPSSSMDFHRVVEPLSERYRLVLHDHLGFGLSDKPAVFSYSLLEQAQIALELWRTLGVESGCVVGHDYGTSVATELLALRARRLLPVRIEGLVLCNGSVLIDLAKLRLSQRIARSPLLGPAFERMVTRGYFKRVMRRLWGDRGRVVEADLDAIWEGIEHQEGRYRIHAISAYIDERYRFYDRWVTALEGFAEPALILWGRRDPIAVPAIAEGLAERLPSSRLVWLDDVGHYPMLEDPDGWTSALSDFLVSMRDSPT